MMSNRGARIMFNEVAWFREDYIIPDIIINQMAYIHMLNPLRAEIHKGNQNTHLHFMPFRHNDMT